MVVQEYISDIKLAFKNWANCTKLHRISFAQNMSLIICHRQMLEEEHNHCNDIYLVTKFKGPFVFQDT